MATQAERLAQVEQRLSDHEARCEERLAEIRAAAGSTLKAVEGLRTRAWGLAAALLAWALAQVWSASTTRLERLEASAPQAVQQLGLPRPATQVETSRAM
jgi:hypothetical protein